MNRKVSSGTDSVFQLQRVSFLYLSTKDLCAVFRLQFLLNVWCWWCYGRTSENQTKQLASLAPVLVVFQKRLQLYFLWHDMPGVPFTHGCSLATVETFVRLASQIFFCCREKAIHFLTIELHLCNQHHDLVFQSYSF